MRQNSKLSISIVTYNSADKVGDTISTIIKYTKGITYTLYVSDNNSSDTTKEIVLHQAPNTVFIQNNDNIGFGKAHNKVIPLIDSKYHAIVNPDIVLENDVLSEICEYMDSHPDAVMVTPKILYPDKTEQKLPKRKPRIKYLLSRRLPFMSKLNTEYTRANEEFKEPTEIDFCTGCFIVIRTDVFKEIGGFDEDFFMYFEDAALTLSAQKYGKTILLPSSSVIHLWERSSAKSLKYLLIHIKSAFKFIKKY